MVLFNRIAGNIDPIYHRLYNWKEEKSRTRLLLVIGELLGSISNVFITGTFYTGFLSQNGIDIVNVGIIAFIPYFSWFFGLLSPGIMHRFKKRRGILLFNHLFYYGCVVLGTTVMPIFVKAPGARTLWFAGFLLAGNIVNALFGPGATAWHIAYVPEDEHERTAYFSMNFLLRNVVSMAVAIGAALLADALAGSEKQYTVLAVLRYVSFGLMVVCGYLYYIYPREYPYKMAKTIRLRDVMVKPLKHKYFMMCVLTGSLWDFIAQCNANTWSYYVLNTVGIRYLFTYTSTIVAAIGSLTMAGWWRRQVAQYGSLRVFVGNIITSGLMELLIGFTTPKTVWLFVLVSIIQGLNLVGAQISVNKLFYICMPSRDTDIYNTFWSFTVNVFIFAGQLLGTAFIAWSEKHGTFSVLGMELYGSQLLVWIKFAAFMAMAALQYRFARIIQPQPGEAIAVQKNTQEDLAEAAAAARAGEE